MGLVDRASRISMGEAHLDLVGLQDRRGWRSRSILRPDALQSLRGAYAFGGRRVC